MAIRLCTNAASGLVVSSVARGVPGEPVVVPWLGKACWQLSPSRLKTVLILPEMSRNQVAYSAVEADEARVARGEGGGR